MRRTLLWMVCCVLLGCSAELDGLANGSATNGTSVDPIRPVDPMDPSNPADAAAPPPSDADAGSKGDAGASQDAGRLPPSDEDASEPMPEPDGGATPPLPAFVLTSTTISGGGTFPIDHTCDGKDQSPPLLWTGAPSGTLSYAVVITDLDGSEGGSTGGSNNTGGSSGGSSNTGGSSGGSDSGGANGSSSGTGASGGGTTGASAGTSGGSSGTSSGSGPGGNTGMNGSGPGGNTGMNGSGPGGNTGMNGSGPGGNSGMNGSGPGGNTGMNGGGPGGNSGMSSGNGSGENSGGPGGRDSRGSDDAALTQGYGAGAFAQAPGFAQWVIWDVGALNTQLPQKIARGVLPANVPGAKQVRGLAPLGIAGGGSYAGPCPGENVTHRYEFKLYALGVALLPGASTTARPADIVSLIESRGSVLGTATLSASYTGE